MDVSCVWHVAQILMCCRDGVVTITIIMVNNIASLYWVVAIMMISCVEVYELSLCLSSKELVHLVLILLVTISASKTCCRILVLRDNDIGGWLDISALIVLSSCFWSCVRDFLFCSPFWPSFVVRVSQLDHDSWVVARAPNIIGRRQNWHFYGKSIWERFSWIVRIEQTWPISCIGRFDATFWSMPLKLEEVIQEAIS